MPEHGCDSPWAFLGEGKLGDVREGLDISGLDARLFEPLSVEWCRHIAPRI